MTILNLRSTTDTQALLIDKNKDSISNVKDELNKFYELEKIFGDFKLFTKDKFNKNKEKVYLI